MLLLGRVRNAYSNAATKSLGRTALIILEFRSSKQGLQVSRAAGSVSGLTTRSQDWPNEKIRCHPASPLAARYSIRVTIVVEAAKLRSYACLLCRGFEHIVPVRRITEASR